MKFGGSSICDAERIVEVERIIRKHLNDKPVIVFSAMGRTTDMLIDAGKRALSGTVEISEIEKIHLIAVEELKLNPEPIVLLLNELSQLLQGVSLIKELSKKTHDYLLSFGERLAVRVISQHLTATGVPAKFFDAWDLGFITDSNFGDAEIQDETFSNIPLAFKSDLTEYSYTPIVTGFIAKDRHGDPTTLGRGGSDLTASILGAALGATEVIVWKDVNGILTTDPRIVPDARPVPLVSFEEAAELAFFGAKVLHPLSIEPAMKRGIPVRVKNSYNPTHPGTVILGRAPMNEDCPVRAITCKRDVTLFDISSTKSLGKHGFLTEVFKVFSDLEISVHMIATSDVSISLTLEWDHDLEQAEQRLKKIANVNVEHGKAILSLIGDVERASIILDRTFRILSASDVNVQMISQGASKVNIALIIEDSQIEKCIRELHKHFFEKETVSYSPDLEAPRSLSSPS
jgi:aspartate kinase